MHAGGGGGILLIPCILRQWFSSSSFVALTAWHDQ
jgi:hypothetical protein